MNLFKLIAFITILPILLGCKSGTTTSDKRLVDTLNQGNKQKEDSVNLNNDYQAERSSYDSLTIPAFFKQLIQNHMDDYMALDSNKYDQVCAEYGLKNKDKENRNRFFTISILHDLFTSNTSVNCSRGPILNIPYIWHWRSPNKRKEITHLEHNQPLKEIDPPPHLNRYDSYAIIDRTPFLFLSDLFTKTPNYYLSDCDTFSTFGWCSEREMAFICLLEILNVSSKGKVNVSGNHSWSELIVPMNSGSGEKAKMKVKVDNTYNRLEWQGTIDSSNDQWQERLLNKTRLAKWYNKKAHSERQKVRLKNHIASNQAMQRIERKLVRYLNEQFKDNR